ncbi:hypothetical protein [Wansuia hejianensis]|uniref:Uncharacterized protein n=1 Tax=Wansuia hejianensis TaxID=2763667 RepID=A0A926F131_9FIRM|nr:hypothetical protein [Wansuia hejianensis]MBC8591152.1 hypothetical protein [Wansuia hejianensis]
MNGQMTFNALPVQGHMSIKILAFDVVNLVVFGYMVNLVVFVYLEKLV